MSTYDNQNLIPMNENFNGKKQKCRKIQYSMISQRRHFLQSTTLLQRRGVLLTDANDAIQGSTRRNEQLNQYRQSKDGDG